MERDKMSEIENLEGEYKTLLASKISIMRDEEEKRNAEKFAAAKLAQDKANEEKIASTVREQVAAFMSTINIGKPVENPIPIDASGIKNEKEVPKMFSFAQKYAKGKGLKTIHAYEDYAENYVANGIAAFTDSDTGCDPNTSSWENVDYFADMIWETVLCHSDFLSKGLTVKGLDFTKGNGGIVQIRVITPASPSDDISASSPCTCLTCVSNTFTTYTLTMETYGDYKVLCDEDIFTLGDVYKTAIMNSMMSRAMERIDNKFYTEIEAVGTYNVNLTASATCTATRGTYGACCTYTVDLYDSIIDLEATMRAAGYFQNADPVLIISPTVAAFLKYKDGLNMPSYIAATIGMDGIKLASIGNIRVIESCHANPCGTVAKEVAAVLIDPSRAVGEAWGKRPTFKVDDDPIECGSQKVVLRMWLDIAILDVGAVGHIHNP
jgi:hypothetical protein